VAAPLILAPIIASQGWRAGYWTIGGAVLLSLAPVAGFLLLAPPLDDRREAIVGKDPSGLPPAPFFKLLAAIHCVALGVGGAVVHFVPMLTDNGFSPQQAAGFASLLGLALIAGRLLTGFAVDRLFAPHLAAGLMAFASLGFLVLAFSGSPLLPMAALLVGLALGAETDLVAYLASRYFDRRIYGRAYGLLYGGFLAGVALSPLLYARLFELFGNYRMGLIASFMALMAAATLFAALPRFPLPMPEES
jgi:predicted MFS family arabinose efflux permease